jgi:hypothetical protein
MRAVSLTSAPSGVFTPLKYTLVIASPLSAIPIFPILVE